MNHCYLHYVLFFFATFPFFFCTLGLHAWYMEIPGLGVQSELQPLAYTTATATQDPSCIWDLHWSSWQCWILNPLSKARDWSCNLMVTSQICFHCTTMGTPLWLLSIFFSFAWVFSNLIYISEMAFFEFIFFEFTKFLEFVHLWLWTSFRSFHSLFLQIFFFFLHLRASPSLWVSNDITF